MLPNPTDDDTPEWKLTLGTCILIGRRDVRELIEKFDDDEVKELQSKVMACKDKLFHIVRSHLNLYDFYSRAQES